jgi:hypothetical protein
MEDEEYGGVFVLFVLKDEDEEADPDTGGDEEDDEV